MGNPWDELVGKTEDAFKTSLGDLWKGTQDAGPFYKALAEDMARETYLVVAAKTDDERKLHQDNLEFLAATAYVRATRMSLQAIDRLTSTANDILSVAVKIGSGLLKGLIPI